MGDEAREQKEADQLLRHDGGPGIAGTSQFADLERRPGGKHRGIRWDEQAHPVSSSPFLLDAHSHTIGANVKRATRAQ